MTEKIVIITHPSKPIAYSPLTGWLFTIGSVVGNDLVLVGDGVAARHARLEEKGGRWMVTDLDSPGGTFMAQNALLPGIAEEWLPGEQLNIGPYTLEMGDGPIPVAAPPPPPPVAAPEPIPTDPSTPPLQLNLQPAMAVVKPGESVEFTLEIDNQTGDQTDVRLRVEGIPADWVVAQPGPIALFAHQRARVPLMIQPPRDSSAAAGQHRFAIAAESSRHGGKAPAAHGALTVSPFSQSAVSFASLPLQHGRANTVRIHNQGNTPDNYEIVAVDAGRELTFDLPQSRIALGAGQEEALPITASARKRPLLLSSRVIPLEVRAQTDFDTIVGAGQVRIPPILSPLLLLLLAVPILLLALFGGRAYLCRDRVENATNATYNTICGTGAAEADVAPGTEPTFTPTGEDLVAPLTPETLTLEPTATATLVASGPVTCEGALPTQLTVGGAARVSNLANTTLRVRSEPRGDGGPDTVVCVLREGRPVNVLDGPVCDGIGHFWYQIRSQDTDIVCTAGGEPTTAEGWAVESDDGFYYLEPVE